MGDYVVAFVASRGAPAGGIGLRGPLGRKVFRSTGLFQGVVPGPLGGTLVTNRVTAVVFGVPFAVGLRGAVVPPTEPSSSVGDATSTTLSDAVRLDAQLRRMEGEAQYKRRSGFGTADDTVTVVFDPARLTLPFGEVRIGRRSVVTLQTTFVDDRVRLGLGSFGSRFVFTRGGDAATAGLDRVGNIPRRECVAPTKKLVVGATLVGIAALALAAVVATATWLPLVDLAKQVLARGMIRGTMEAGTTVVLSLVQGLVGTLGVGLSALVAFVAYKMVVGVRRSKGVVDIADQLAAADAGEAERLLSVDDGAEGFARDPLVA